MVRIWERYKAWLRGERMIPGVNRGRCFEKINGSETSEVGSPMKTKATPKLETLKIRVIRKDGSIEEIDNG